MNKKDFLSTTELAKLLGISRIAVFKKIKKGDIKAKKIGRNFFIHRKDLGIVLGNALSSEDKKEINRVIKKAIKDYGETLRLLGRE